MRFDAEFGEAGIAVLFGPIAGEGAGQKHDGTSGEDGPALAAVADHRAERVGETGGNNEDHDHLQEIGEGRGIFKWVRGIGVEEAAAVGADHLDGFLRCDRALGDDLFGAFERFGDRIGMEILNDALRAEDQRANDGERQQDIKSGAGEIDPEIANAVHLLAGESAGDGDGDGDTGGGGSEILHRERGHLDEVAEGGFAAVGLPIGVGHEADGGVEGQIGGTSAA